MRNSLSAAVWIAILLVASVSAVVPTVINYQGRLTDPGGIPVADGEYEIRFQIYDDPDPAATTPLWSSGPRHVAVSGGMFSYLLGDSVALPDDLFAGDAALWLGVTVGTDVEMSPRRRLSSSPMAAVAARVMGDIRTSPGKMRLVDDPSGVISDSGILIANSVDRGDGSPAHVTILKVAGGGTDTTNLVGLFGDPDFARIVIGDGGANNGLVIASSVDKGGEPIACLTFIKVAGGGSDTTNLIGLFGDPDFARMQLGDGNSPDSGIVITNTVDNVDHNGHVNIIRVARSGADTTNIVGLFGDPDFARIQVGDGNSPDSGIVVTNAVDNVEHHGHVNVIRVARYGADTTNLVGLFGDPDFARIVIGDGSVDSGLVITSSVDKGDESVAHVTILKVAGGGSDTTNLIGLFGDPDFARIIIGDGGVDSGIVVSSGVKEKEYIGHVTLLRIANNGADTSNMVGLFGDPDFARIVIGDGGVDSGLVIASSVDKGDESVAHVTILKVAGGGTDTTNLIGLFGDPDFARIVIGDGGADSGLVIASSVDKGDESIAHVTILKVAGGGADTTNLVGLFGDPDFARVVVGDDNDPDSGIVVTTAVDRSDHHGHITVLKIADGGRDTTEIVRLNGDSDEASLQLKGGSGSGGSILLQTGITPGSGMIGVNKPNPAYAVDVVGTICATGGMCGPSDQRLKDDIEPLTDAMSVIQALNPVRYNWRHEEYPERHFSTENQIGLIAQEVKDILPELVSEGSDGFYALDYARLTPVLVAAVKKQQETISDLQQDVAELTDLVKTLLAANQTGSGKILVESEKKTKKVTN